MTSIEWLIERIAEASTMEKGRYYISYNSGTIDITNIIEQAKEMHYAEYVKTWNAFLGVLKESDMKENESVF